jgi:cytochrome P450
MNKTDFAGKGRKDILYIILVYFIYKKLPFKFKIPIFVGTAIYALREIMNMTALPVINKNPPNVPKEIPFFGHTLSLLQGARFGITKFIKEFNEELGFKTWEVSTLNDTTILLMDPLDRKYVLKDNWKNFVKNPENCPKSVSFQDIFSELLGRGIFAIDGSEWQVHRKIASHMFSINSLNSHMLNVFEEHTSRLVYLLDNQCINKEVNKEIDIQIIFQAFTFDTICEIVFGINPNSLNMAINNKKEDFLVAFDKVQVTSTLRAFEPTFLWKFKKYLSIGEENELVENMKFINDYVLDIVKSRKRNNNYESCNDLLSLYIQYSKKNDILFSDDYLKDVILNFMLAGRDTTSCTLINWIKLVSIHSECIDKIIENTDYEDAVFNEVIRMYPPVPNDFRIAQEDDVLPGSRFKVKKGYRVGISNFLLGRDPSLWKDPNQFKPDRWISRDSSGNIYPIKRPDEYIFPVFWGGPRLCLGKDMARLETKIVSSALVKNFKFEILEHEENYVNGPVMFYKKGLPVIISRKT